MEGGEGEGRGRGGAGEEEKCKGIWYREVHLHDPIV